MRRWKLSALSLSLATSCSPEVVRQPLGWDDALAVATATDLDPEPGILEIDLVAREAEVQLRAGAATRLYTYDGSLPGPTLRLRQGDRLRVHFRNELPEPTSIHWHGVRLENAMDGAPPHTQEPVLPGGTFDYDFVAPDAGTYWYHPHVRSAAQVAAGLYGALIVDPPTGPEDPSVFGDEVVLVLSDILLDEDNQLGPADAGGDLGTLFGREGNVLLANGVEDAELLARRGLRQRWRVINAARSRYFQLDLGGLPFDRIGGDAGMIGGADRTTAPLIVPGGRADLVVTPEGPPDATVPLRWLPYDRGFGSTEYRDPETVLRVRLSESSAEEPMALRPPPVVFEPLTTFDSSVEVELTRQTAPDGSLVMGINGVPFDEAPPFPATVGEVQRWTVTNRMEFSHPFHLHGFFFQPLDAEDRPVGEWMDTADVPHTDGELRFLVRYDNRPGMWMFHCHVLDHADAGMMGMIDLQR